MSDTDLQAIDILLPEARLAVFSRDSDTVASAMLVQEDWRFARIDVTAVEGDVETAIDAYRSEESPDLLIIQTDVIDDAFTAKLGELSEHCDEGTAAIIIGPVNDVYLYRKLIDMGVSDYLVRPITANILSEVVAKALIERLGVSDSRLVAFVGSKGGVGTSSIAQMAAWIISEQMGQKTLLMDGAGGWSSLSVGMGFDSSASLHEVSRAVEANGEEALNRMIHDLDDKLSVIATGSDAMLDTSVSADQFEAIINDLMVKSPLVLVDLSSAEASVQKTVLTRAHHVFAVTTPTITALRLCRTLLKEISDLRGGECDDISLIVNKAGVCKSHEISNADIGEAIDFTPDISISYSPSSFIKYESNVRALLLDKEGKALASRFMDTLNLSLIHI